MKLFAYTLSAVDKKGEVMFGTGLLIEEDMDTAKTFLDVLSVKTFPISEGWTKHKIDPIPSPDTFLYPDGRRFRVSVTEEKEG